MSSSLPTPFGKMNFGEMNGAFDRAWCRKTMKAVHQDRIPSGLSFQIISVVTLLFSGLMFHRNTSIHTLFVRKNPR